MEDVRYSEDGIRMALAGKAVLVSKSTKTTHQNETLWQKWGKRLEGKATKSEHNMNSKNGNKMSSCKGYFGGGGFTC